MIEEPRFKVGERVVVTLPADIVTINYNEENKTWSYEIAVRRASWNYVPERSIQMLDPTPN